MNKKIYPVFLIALIIGSHAVCSSSSGVFTGADAAKTFRGAKALMKSNPEIRFAVLDFTDSSGSFTAYGRIIGDETFYRLSALKGIHLLERQRLSAILEEHSLEQSGLVSGEAGDRLGRILPADIITAGSYVFEGDRIRVNGRFTEIRTGEIRGTFMYYLGSPEARAETGKKPEEEPADCEPYEKMIEPLMRDLRTPAMVEKAARTAIRIPYTMTCRRIHQSIMGTFARGGLYPEPYIRFLRETVIAIPDPEETERKNAVFHYFQSDKKIDELEWNAGILSMKNANERTARRVVYYILNRCGPQDETLLFKRIDTLMGMAGAGAFGKPRPLSRDQMFQAIFRAGPPEETTRMIRLYLLDKYSHGVARDTRNLSYILSYSEKSLISEKDKGARRRFYEHIRAIFDSADPEGKDSLVLQLIKFIHEMHYRFGKEDAPELRALSTGLSPWFCRALTQIRSDYRLRSAIPVIRKYNIRCTHFKEDDR